MDEPLQTLHELAATAAGSGLSEAGQYESFPDVSSRDIVLADLEYRPIVSTRTLGKYRIQRKGIGDQGPVFILTLFGSICSKLRLVMWWRELTKQDQITAMQRAIERQIGYFQNLDAPLPVGADGPIEIDIRDTDFVVDGQEGAGAAPAKHQPQRRSENEHHQ